MERGHEGMDGLDLNDSEHRAMVEFSEQHNY
jgi:hypothetical protein